MQSGCVWGKYWSSSDIAFSGQKKAVVIRHLYNEDGENISDSSLSTMTDVSEACAVSDLKDTEIKTPEEKIPEIKCEQQVRIWDVFSRCQYFLFQCIWLLQRLTLEYLWPFELLIMAHYHYLRISKTYWI